MGKRTPEEKAARKARWKVRGQKIKSFFKKIGAWLIVWGKPMVRKAIVTQLAPKLKEVLKDKIDAGNYDKKVDNLIDKGVDAAIVEFNKKF